MKTIDIYCPDCNAKTFYVLDFIFEAVQDYIYRICKDKADIIKNNGIVNYSSENIDGALSIPLLENTSSKAVPHFNEHLTVQRGTFNFDCIAAIFYLLSRVEEYDVTTLDQHGRYLSTSSILHQKKLLNKPIVDYWVRDFFKAVSDYYSIEIKFSQEFNIVSTVDVDHIYAFRSKALLLRIGSYIKDVITLNIQRLKDKSMPEDPFDTYEYISDLHKELRIECKYFVLCADRSQYDRSLLPIHPDFVDVIGTISRHSRVGIHPSYYSSEKPALISKEKKALERVIAKEIDISRQHYLKMQVPETYSQLIMSGIKHDYSMGYSDQLGFRSGTSRSYKWFDCNKNEITKLTVHPFCIMDVTLRRVSAGDTTKAINIAKDTIDTIKAVGGTFSIVWHNSSFYGTEGWTGWDKVYSEILRYAKSCIS